MIMIIINDNNNEEEKNNRKKKKFILSFHMWSWKCVTLFLVLLTAVKLEQADRRPSALRRVYVHVTTTTSTESAIYHCQLLSTTTAIVYHYYYYRYYHYYYHYYYQSCYVSSWTNRTNRESALAGVTSLAEVLEQTILPSISFLHFFSPSPFLCYSFSIKFFPVYLVSICIIYFSIVFLFLSLFFSHLHFLSSFSPFTLVSPPLIQHIY